MTEKLGLPSALFSVKSYIAAMLSLYISMRIGLENPYWAYLSSYIVAQPLAGAVISKAIFRLIGTFIGAAVTVILVPQLVNTPELLSLALACWVGLCVYLSVLDRTPRSYAFILAGYSACIIGFPSIAIPDQTFMEAALRVQEIGIGIVCSTVVHALVLPGSVTTLLLKRVRTIVGDAERWSSDAVSPSPSPELDAERRRLAQDVTELHHLSTHLPFDISRHAPRVRTVRALQDQLSLLLPLGAAVQDRLEALRDAKAELPSELRLLLDDVQAWLRDPGDDHDDRHATAEALAARCRAMEPETSAPMDWNMMVRLSLLARLATLVSVHRDCRDLIHQIGSHSNKPVTARVVELQQGRRSRELHKDHGAARRSALGAFVTVLGGCALWIGSGWSSGSVAVMMAGIYCSLTAASANQLAPLKGFIIGTLIGALIGGVYAYAILPNIHDFEMLAIVLAPALLVVSYFASMPRYAGMAFPTLVGMSGPALFSTRYVNLFADFANTAVAQLAGIWFAGVMLGLLRSAGSQHAVYSTMRATWADIATRSTSTAQPDVRAWINRMLDRVGLLAPRLAAAGQDSSAPLYNALRDMRTGIAIGELRQLRLEMPAEERAPLSEVLSGVGKYYSGLDPKQERRPDPVLLASIDASMSALSAHVTPQTRRDATLALVSLRRNLFADAPAYSKLAS